MRLTSRLLPRLTQRQCVPPPTAAPVHARHGSSTASSPTPPTVAQAPCVGRHTDMKQKPSLPEGYEVPDVWQPVSAGAMFAAINSHTAGAREDGELPRGAHALQLYSLGTPNGQKVTIMLEELGVEYDAWQLKISGEQFTSGFVRLNPNSKIPALYDYEAGRDGPIRLFESGSILVYLADKHKRFIPQDVAGRAECINWLMWQMSTGPIIGQAFGHFFAYADSNIEYCINRYTQEVKRVCDVLDRHLDGKQYVCGTEYTIADMAMYPWFFTLSKGGYKNAQRGCNTFLEFPQYTHIVAWLARLGARKAVVRGMRVNHIGKKGVRNRHSKGDFRPEHYSDEERRTMAKL
eukprot:Rhum_TRINITY_DN10709_c0_g2::Rhum_TRINITY_DN10709_c0_g2_i1::g.39762::m.39762/K11209/yghU, yfcG; GSH-dependent disulfide-bond oxidoreductase